MNNLCEPASRVLTETELLEKWKNSLHKLPAKKSARETDEKLIIHSGIDYGFLYPLGHHEYKRKLRAEKAQLNARLGIVQMAVKTVCQLYGIEKDDLLSANRNRDFIMPRLVFSQAMRDAGFSLTFIANHLNRNHTTILHYSKRFQDIARPDDLENVKLILSILKGENHTENEAVNSAFDFNASIAKQIAHRVRGIETTLTEKLFKANLECVVCAVMAHFNYSFKDIAMARGIDRARAKSRVEYINQVCKHHEILQLKKAVITRLNELCAVAVPVTGGGINEKIS